MIDIKNKQFWEFTSSYEENFTERNPSLKNEGFTFVRSLDEDNIEAFILDSSRYGFTDWKGVYKDDHIFDGHQWGITIIFSDATRKEVNGSNKYPETWNEMYDVFINLTGQDILLQKDDN